MGKVEDLKAELDEIGASVGRFANENSRLRTSDRKNYERVRRLENAIRKHAEKKCTCTNPRQCLLELGRLIPKLERLPYKQRKGRVR